MIETTARYCPTCGTELSGGVCPKCVLRLGMRTQTVEPGWRRFVPPSVEELGRKLPELEILELIGHGGMGAVYKARQRELDRLVAVKVLPADPSTDAAFAERFTREARALAKLCHPNIVMIYDFGRTADLCFFVMEYVEGVNLRQMIAAKTLAPADALRIVPQVCEALQFAHDAGVVHRDIKPENILVDARGRVKIADFGLAKLLDPAHSDLTLTGEHHVVGTPRYMAPEQMERPATVDHRADIYSLGVVLYEMLTGELPLGRFAPPSQKVQVDVRLDEVVLRTLEKEPARRYQQASEVKTDLGSLSVGPARAARPLVRDNDEEDEEENGSLGRGSWFDHSASERWWTKAMLWAVVLAGLLMAFSYEYRAEARQGRTEYALRLGTPGAWLKWKHEPGRAPWRSVDLNLITWSFGGGVAAAVCAMSLLRIRRIERRRRERQRRPLAAGRERAGGYVLPPANGPMLALAGGGLVVSGLCMTAGIALGAMGLVRETPGSQQFWGWMGGAMGCFFGGAGGLAGSWNTYRQLTGRRDWMSEPGTTALDRAMRWYALLGLGLLVALGWRSFGDATRHALLLMGGLVTVQAVMFIGIRAVTRSAAREADAGTERAG
jgi:predicted Ser/Thr protein kinase